MWFSTSNMHIFISTGIAFAILNTIENLIHFMIGRDVSNKNEFGQFKIQWPTKDDLFKIIIVMIIFMILQGGLSVFFERIFFGAAKV